MFREIFKKSAKKIILGMLAVLLFTSFNIDVASTNQNTPFTTPTAHAAELCNGGSDALCDIPVDHAGGCAAVEGGYVKDPNLSGENRLVCRKSGASDLTNDFLDSVTYIIAIQSMLNHVLWPVLVMIGGLMDNELLFGAGMQERLRDIWIIVRNLVNVLFVVILVGIALYNILGVGDENSNYAIKTALPKIIIGIILVNFSFTISKVVLDGVNVLTTSVFLLPDNVSEELTKVVDEDNKQETEQICRSIGNISTSTSDETAEKNQKQAEVKKVLTDSGLTDDELKELEIDDTKPDEVPGKLSAALDREDLDGGLIAKITKASTGLESIKSICLGKKLTPAGKAFLTKWNQHNAAFALAVSMGKVVFFDELHFSGLNSIDDTLVNTIMSMLLYLAYVAAFLALFVVLLVRLVVLWVGIALSPILVLIYGAPDLKEKLGGIGEISGEFLANAIAPLKIALTLTIGWIMVNTLSSLNGGALSQAFPAGNDLGLPVVGMSTIQNLIVSCAVLVIVFKGAFSAADGTIAKEITGKIESAAKGAASYVGQIPLRHINAVPVKLPDGSIEKASLSELKYFGEQLRNKDQTKDQGLWNKFTKGNTPVNATHLAKLGSVDQFQKWLNSNEKGLQNGDKTIQDHMARLNRDNTALHNKIMKGDNPNLKRAYENYLAAVKSKDDGQIKTAGAELAKFKAAEGMMVKELEGAKTADGKKESGDTASLKATKPGDWKPKAEPDTKEKIFGDKTAEDISGDGDTGTKTQAVTAAFKGNLSTLQKATESYKSGDRGEVIKAIRGIGGELKKHTNGTNGVKTVKQAKAAALELLNGDQGRLKILIKHVGGENELLGLIGNPGGTPPAAPPPAGE